MTNDESKESKVETRKQNRVRESESQTEDLNYDTPSVDTPATVPNLAEGSATEASAGEVKTRKGSADLQSKFLSVSGYKEGDILGSSEDRRTFVTKSGGKYELSPKGTRVRVLSGPNPPALEQEAQQAAQEAAEESGGGGAE